MRRDCRILLGGVPLFARPAAQSRFCSVVYKALFSELAARVHSGKTVILSSEDAKNRGPGVPPIRRELKNGLRLLVKTQFQRDFSIAPVQHRRAALYPAEPRVLGGSFSRLVGPRQRPARAKGEGARPRRQGSHVRIVSGAPEKHVPSVPRLWRLYFIIYPAEDRSFRPRGIAGVQMNHVVR